MTNNPGKVRVTVLNLYLVMKIFNSISDLKKSLCTQKFAILRAQKLICQKILLPLTNLALFKSKMSFFSPLDTANFSPGV